MSAKLIFVAVLIVCATAVLGAAVVQARRVREALETERQKTLMLAAENKQLLESLTDLKNELAEAREMNVSTGEAPSPAGTPELQNKNSPSRSTPDITSDLPIVLKEGGTVWRAKQEVSEIERHLALEPGEKERVLRGVKDGLEQGLQADSRLIRSVMLEALGEERTAKYEKLKSAAEEKELLERIGREVIVVSRKLGLSGEQEQKMSAIIESVERSQQPKRIILNNKMREAMALHFEDDAAKDVLKVRYDEISEITEQLKKERQQMIFSESEGILNDQQKNMLLELQAKE